MPNTKRSIEQDALLTHNELYFWEHDGKAYMCRIQQDEDPEDPRSEDTGRPDILACFHPRHNLGDDTGFRDAGSFWDDLVKKQINNKSLLALLTSGKITRFMNLIEDEGVRMDDPDELLELCHDAICDGNVNLATDILDDRIAWLPMWMYEHSGITVSCGDRVYPYNDQFDSSAIGWAVMTKDKAISELGADETNWREKALACLRASVESYDKYLTGDIWCYDVYRSDRPIGCNEDGMDNDGGHISDEDSWEEQDACCGFEGGYLVASGIPEAVGNGFAQALASGEYWTGKAEPRTVTVWTYVRDTK